MLDDALDTRTGRRNSALRPNCTSGRVWCTSSPANLALLKAAREALDMPGEFLRRNLAR